MELSNFRQNQMSKKYRNNKPTLGSQVHLLPLEDHLEQLSFNPEAFDEFIRSQGVTFVHYRALPSPLGKIDRDDIRHSFSDFGQVSNGFIYIKAGEFTAAMTSNSQKIQEQPDGLYDFSTAYITIPRFYDNSQERVILSHYDRIYLKDIESEVINFQMVEASIRGSDRLQYPAIKVEHIIDSQGKCYAENQDFKIDEYGNIQWCGQNQPGIDPKTQKGRVYSIRYRYNAFWYIKELVHEIRVSQVTDPDTFDRKVERMPYFAAIQREYVFENIKQNDSYDNQREVQAPPQNKLPPR